MNIKFFTVLFFLLFFILLPFFFKPENLTRRNGDFSDLVWPNYYFIKSSIMEYKQIPLWNPTVFSGIPEISNPQSPIIYPVNAVVLFLPLDFGIVILIFIHFLFSGVFAYKIGKLFKWSNVSCFTLTVSFIFSPFLWGKVAVGHVSQLFATLLLMPAVYFGIQAFLQGRKRDYFMLSLFLAMQYLNHPTIWFYTIFFGALSWTYFSITEKNYGKIFLVTFPAVFSLILILPIFLLQIRTGPYITRSSLELSDLSMPLWSIKRFLKSIFIPSNIAGDSDTETWLYPSLTTVFFSFLGYSRLGKKFKIFSCILIFFVVLITLGSRTPFFNLMVEYFPGFSYLRVSTRDWFVVVFVLSALCGFFMQSSRIKTTFLLVLFLDLYSFSILRLWSVPSEMIYGNSFNFRELLEADSGRYYCTKRCLSARDSLPEKINTADGYHLMILKNYRQVLSGAGGFPPPKYTGNIPSIEDENAQPDARLLGGLSVKWIISDKELSDPGFMKRKKTGGYTLYENKFYLSRFRFNSSENKVFVLKDTPNEIQVKTKGSADTLVLADTYFPGWEVWVDGKNEKIFEEEGWARAVKLESGEHVVDFKFVPFNHIFD